MPYKDKSAQRERFREWRKTPRGAFNVHRQNARNRGIDFLFTFDEWWQMWQESCQWHLRGRRRGNYCMARFGDDGPYSKNNCVIVKLSANSIASLIKHGRATQGAKYKDGDITRILEPRVAQVHIPLCPEDFT